MMVVRAIAGERDRERESTNHKTWRRAFNKNSRFCAS